MLHASQIQAVLDMPYSFEKRVEVQTHSGSTYTIAHGEVSGPGTRNQAVRYTHCEPKMFVAMHNYDERIRKGDIVYKLDFYDSAYGRSILCTSPVVAMAVTVGTLDKPVWPR